MENNKMYISDSKKNIDEFIDKGNYKAAFGLLIVFLERLDVDYYSKDLEKVMLGLKKMSNEKKYL